MENTVFNSNLNVYTIKYPKDKMTYCLIVSCFPRDLLLRNSFPSQYPVIEKTKEPLKLPVSIRTGKIHFKLHHLCTHN